MESYVYVVYLLDFTLLVSTHYSMYADGDAPAG